MRSLGIDIGVAKGLDLVLMDERRVPLVVKTHVGPGEVGALLDELRPDVLAIDSPPRWAKTGRSRLTERQLATCNIQSFHTPSEAHGRGNPFFRWMEVGFEVFRIAEEHGFPPYAAGNPKGRAMEVFPHGTAVVLAGSLPPKGSSKRTWREHVLRAQGVRTDELTSIDRIDAALAALTGVLAMEGRRFAPGDPTDGVIVLPVNSLPAKPYRSAARPLPTGAPLFNYCACGDPACQELVRAEFARGHDAKRKAMLWQRVREGQDAIEEIEERGWKLPPEMR